MRVLSWLMLLAIATGAGAAGEVFEFNPVRTHPHSDYDGGEQRILVKLRSSAAIAAASGQSRAMSADLASVDSSSDRVVSLTQRVGLHLNQSRHIFSGLHVMRVNPATAGESIETTLQRLRADPEVEYAERDQRRFPHAVPSDPLYPIIAGQSGQWYLQPPAMNTPSAIDAETAWNTTTGSSGIVIADLDTGIRYEHPDLLWAGPPAIAQGGRVLPGYDFIANVFVANDGDGPDSDAADPGDWVTQADINNQTVVCKDQDVTDSSWHGTRTASIIGAISDNAIGMAGITWKGWILPVRVLGKCGGYDSDITTGMLWAAGVHIAGVPDNQYPAKIENMSLGGTGACTNAYVTVMQQLNAMGVLVVASAGNEGGPVDSPANCPGVAGIGGLRSAGTKVGFSSLGPEAALSAPAGNCVNVAPGSACVYPIQAAFNAGTTGPTASTYTDQINNPNLGTSFSAPIVSGIAALMLSVNGNLNSAQLLQRLKLGATAFPQTSVDANPQPPVCHVPADQNDLQTAECICTNDGQTCGAGMASATGALAQALRPIAAIVVPASVTPGGSVTLNAAGSAAACQHAIATYAWSSTGSAPSSPSAASTTVTAPGSSGAPFTVTLTVTDNAGHADTATVVVSKNSATTSAPASAGSTACLTDIAVPSPVAVTISPTSANVVAGGAPQTFNDAVQDTLITGVSWQVNGITGGNATVGTITTSGAYTPPAMVPSPAMVTVAAVSVADPAQSGSAQVMISAASGGSGASSSGGGIGSGKGGGGALDWLTLPICALLAGSVSSRRRRR